MVLGLAEVWSVRQLTPQQTQELRDYIQEEMQWAWKCLDKDLLRGFINHAEIGVDLEVTSYI